MSAKNVDKYNRFRSITVAFRVSPEEQKELNRAIALSGLPKQEYCYSNSEIRMSGRFEPVYFEKVVSLTIWRKGILNCATKTSFISLLTDKASCFFCFLAIIASSNYPFILICGPSTRKTYIIYFRCKRFC